MVVLIPVRHQHVLAVGLLDEVRKHQELLIMDHAHLPVGIVDRAVCHLQELPGQDRCIGGIDLVVTDLHQQSFFHLVVQFPLDLVHIDVVVDGHLLRHIEVVQRFHGNRDVRDPAVDRFLCTGQRHVVEHHSGVRIHACRFEVRLPEPADEPAEPDAFVDQEGLSPQVKESVAGRCTCQAHHAFDLGTDLPQRLPSLALVIFKAGELIDHHHVEGPRDAALFQIVGQPFQVLPVHNIDICRCPQGCLALLGAAYHHGHFQEACVLPEISLLRPYTAAYT